MKKQYEKPHLEVTEFRFSEHIAASGTNCYSVYTNQWNQTGCVYQGRTNLV